MDRKATLEMERDIRLTAEITLAAIAVGFAFVLAQQYFQDSKDATQRIFFGLLWSLACLVAGGVIGFLFGIPRWLQTDSPTVAPASPPTSNSGENPAPASPANPPRNNRRSYSPNTNLDRISDWLTTIIVGVGLVELETLAQQFDRATVFISSGLAGESGRAVAGAIIIYFSLVGFLGVYLMTRLYLSQVIKGVEEQLGISTELREELLKSDLSNPMRPDNQRPGGSRKPGGELRQILNTPLGSLTLPEEIVIWAKAQLEAQNYSNAIEGYKKAIDLLPNDIQLRLEYANALFYAGLGPWGASRQNELRTENERQLVAAHSLITDKTDPETRMKVYRALTFFYLYNPPPDGFEKVIEYGKEFLNSKAPKLLSGGLLVNLAAAYGQKCAWIRQNDPNNIPAFCENREEAFRACEEALKINRDRWIPRLQMLLQSGVEKDRRENDLEIFERDNKFRRLLELVEVPAAEDTGKICT